MHFALNVMWHLLLVEIVLDGGMNHNSTDNVVDILTNSKSWDNIVIIIADYMKQLWLYKRKYIRYFCQINIVMICIDLSCCVNGIWSQLQSEFWCKVSNSQQKCGFQLCQVGTSSWNCVDDQRVWSWLEIFD